MAHLMGWRQPEPLQLLHFGVKTGGRNTI